MFINKKAVKQYYHARGKQISTAALDALDRALAGVMDFSIAAAGPFPRVMPGEVEAREIARRIPRARGKKVCNISEAANRRIMQKTARIRAEVRAAANRYPFGCFAERKASANS